jgi:hypothetical protein
MLIVPVSYCVGYDETTGHNVYYNPKRFEKQGYSGFSQSENRHIRTVMITLTHQVPGGPGPDFFYAVHNLQASQSSSRSKSIASSGAASAVCLLPALLIRL